MIQTTVAVTTGLALALGILLMASWRNVKKSQWTLLTNKFSQPEFGEVLWKKNGWCSIGQPFNDEVRMLLSVRACREGLVLQPLLIEGAFGGPIGVPWSVVKERPKRLSDLYWHFWEVDDVPIGFPRDISDKLRVQLAAAADGATSSGSNPRLGG